jgi:hypothetical protein
MAFVSFDLFGCGVLLLLAALVALLIALLARRSGQGRLAVPRADPRRWAARQGSWSAVRPQCPECGADLPADAPEGLCPQCLLKGVISSAHQAARSAPAEPTGPYTLASVPSVEELVPLFP